MSSSYFPRTEKPWNDYTNQEESLLEAHDSLAHAKFPTALYYFSSTADTGDLLCYQRLCPRYRVNVDNQLGQDLHV